MQQIVLPILGALIALGGFALGIWIIRIVDRRVVSLQTTLTSQDS